MKVKINLKNGKHIDKDTENINFLESNDNFVYIVKNDNEKNIDVAVLKKNVESITITDF